MSVTVLILIINVVVFTLIIGGILHADVGIYDQYRIRHFKEYYRMLTSGFMHADYLHILFNMYTLYVFGRGLEMVLVNNLLGAQLGHTLYFLLFIFSILGGSIYVFVAKKREQEYYALGASGGVFGVIYATILLIPGIQVSLFFVPIFIDGWIMGILFTVGSIVLSLMPKSENAISHEGHLGGGIMGALLMLLLMRVYGVTLDGSAVKFLLVGIVPGILYLFILNFRPAWIDQLKHTIAYKKKRINS